MRSSVKVTPARPVHQFGCHIIIGVAFAVAGARALTGTARAPLPVQPAAT